MLLGSLTTVWPFLVPQTVKNLLQCRRSGFHSWVRKIPWRKEWLPTPLFLPGEFHGQRNLAGYSSWVTKNKTNCETNTLSPVLVFPIHPCPISPIDVIYGGSLGSWIYHLGHKSCLYYLIFDRESQQVALNTCYSHEKIKEIKYIYFLKLSERS